MAKIQDNAGKEVSETATLNAYFGRQEGQSLQGFMEEIKKLSAGAKTELATLAAKELGYTIVP
jgi:hypothetical protein